MSFQAADYEPVLLELQKKQWTLATLFGVVAVGFVVMVLGAISADNVKRSSAWGQDDKLKTAYDAAIGNVIMGLLGVLGAGAAIAIIMGMGFVKASGQQPTGRRYRY